MGEAPSGRDEMDMSVVLLPATAANEKKEAFGTSVQG